MTTDSVATLLLYVEDEKIIQSSMIAVLEEAGFELLVASSGEEGLDYLETEKKGRIRGLITDVDLGRGPTGWNVARRARLLMARMPVVYASSVDEDDWLVNGVPLSKLVSKPYRPSQVVSAVSSLLMPSARPS